MEGGDAVDDLCGLFLQTLSGFHLLRPLVTDHSSLVIEVRFPYRSAVFTVCNPGLGKPLPLYAAEAVSANLPCPRLLPRPSEPLL